MMVKCRCCGKNIDRSMAFCDSKGASNKYYCTESEYLVYKENCRVRPLILDLIAEISGCKIGYSSIAKAISPVYDVFKPKDVYTYLVTNKNELSRTLNRNFVSGYASVRYLLAIIQNNLRDFLAETEKKEIIFEQDFIYVPQEHNNKQRSTKRRVSFAEFEDEEA